MAWFYYREVSLNEAYPGMKIEYGDDPSFWPTPKLVEPKKMAVITEIRSRKDEYGDWHYRLEIVGVHEDFLFEWCPPTNKKLIAILEEYNG